MAEAKSHEVLLLGKRYKLRSEHDAKHLAELAAYVDAQVAEVQRRGTVATLDAALMAALNIADELHRLRHDAEERLKAIGEKTHALLEALEQPAAAAAPASNEDAAGHEPEPEPAIPAAARR